MKVVKRAKLMWCKKGDEHAGALLATAATVPKDIGCRAAGQAGRETTAVAGQELGDSREKRDFSSSTSSFPRHNVKSRQCMGM